jgi:hypothetical protein
MRINPTVPLGAYPHDRLCGQVGITPTRIRIRIMRTIVPIDISPSNWITVYLQVGLPQPSVAGPGHLTVKLFFTDRTPPCVHLL